MRISDLLLVLGPLILLGFAVGVIDASAIRLLVILGLVAAGVWFGSRVLPGRRPGSGKRDRDKDGGSEQ